MMIWGKKLENSRKNDKKWEIFAIFSILPYTDGYLGPQNLVILHFFKILPWFVQIRFFQRFGNILGERL